MWCFSKPSSQKIDVSLHSTDFLHWRVAASYRTSWESLSTMQGTLSLRLSLRFLPSIKLSKLKNFKILGAPSELAYLPSWSGQSNRLQVHWAVWLMQIHISWQKEQSLSKALKWMQETNCRGDFRLKLLQSFLLLRHIIQSTAYALANLIMPIAVLGYLWEFVTEVSFKTADPNVLQELSLMSCEPTEHDFALLQKMTQLTSLELSNFLVSTRLLPAAQSAISSLTGWSLILPTERSSSNLSALQLP